MQKIKIDKNIRSGNAIVDEYLEGIENELLKKDTLAIHRLIYAANKISVVLANDLDLISTDRSDEARILSDDKESKTLERVMMLLKGVETFKSISDIADTMLPELVDVINKTAEVPIDRTSNVFEQLQEQHYKKNKSK